MRYDVLNQLSDAQVVTASAVSTNSMKKKTITQDLGVGVAEMGLVFAATAATGGGSFTVEIIEADNAALTTNVLSLATMTLTAVELATKKLFFLALPGYKMTKEFYGARFVPVGGSSPSATLVAYFGAEADAAQYKSFASTYKVEN